ncbi:MAG: hypothetical protein HY905_25485 [Deltaproteobacteria bacterium]|nr:hypothetical protein [Deltaproteobacteria bacterium]
MAALFAYDVRWWSGDPHLGEPTVLFQVHPMRPDPLFCTYGSCDPDIRQIRVVFTLLWDLDSGHPGDCEESSFGYAWHCGDNQQYEVDLIMNPTSPRQWSVWNADVAAWWSSNPPPEGDPSLPRVAPDVVAEFHPVLMLSQGKHHNWPVTDEDAVHAGSGFAEDWYCPDAGSTWRDEWRYGPGLNLPPVEGNMAFPLYDRSSGFALPRGNNVGESDHVGWPFADDLSEFCLFVWNPWAEPPSGDLPHWCFFGESAWSETSFRGGHTGDACGWDGWCGPFADASPMSHVWVAADTAFFGDLDGDTVVNYFDTCYLDPGDAGDGPWPVAGSYSGELDGDGDGAVDECDACPEDPTAWEPRDTDDDGVADGCDYCPDHGGTRESDYRPRMGAPPNARDSDGDGIGDTCDLCPHGPRTDTGFVGSSAQYNRSPGDHWWQDPDSPFNRHGPASTADSDGDDIGDACDLCPFSAGGPYAGTWCNEDDANCVVGFGLELDGDGDFVGVRCDNCPGIANPDQFNCNEADERDRYDRKFGHASGFVGHGDACDATPCVVKCENVLHPGTPEITPVANGERWSIMPDADGGPCDGTHVAGGVELCECGEGEPASMGLCTVGFADPDAATDWDPGLGSADTGTVRQHELGPADTGPRDMTLGLQTEFRGCACTDEEIDAALCDRRVCPEKGLFGTERRWEDATWLETGGIPGGSAYPSYRYRRLYTHEEGAGDGGVRYETTGSWAAWYSPYFRGPDAPGAEDIDSRYFVQKWYFLSDQERDADGRPLFPLHNERQTFAWYKPGRNVTAGYGGFPVAGEGNYYFRERMGGEVHRCDYDHPVFEERVREIIGRYTTLYGTEAWTPMHKPPTMGGYAALLNGDCIYCRDYLFESPGEYAGGILVYGWDSKRKQYTNFVGTKTAGALFELRLSAFAFGHDGDHKIDSYWVFGGVDAAGAKNDQFWMARLVEPMVIGTETPAAYFALSQAPRGTDDAWPAARVGANLAAAIPVSGVLTPKPVPVPSAAGADADSGATGEAGSVGSSSGQARSGVVLVGGQGEYRLLDDIWMFDGRWRQVGSLPGIDEGLAEAGAAVVGTDLWLFGGRQRAGASDDLWRIDLGTGVATKVDAGSGPAPRVQPALAYREDAHELLVFGGKLGEVGLNDLWAFDIDAGTWRLAAEACSGVACPIVVGGEELVPTGPGDNLTVLANPGGPAGELTSWSLESGTWKTLLESFGFHETRDCDGDHLAELAWGARCGAGGDGFPSYGAMMCDSATSSLTCRAPAAPAAVVTEYRTPGVQAVVAGAGFVGVVKNREVDGYRLLPDAALEPGRTIRLNRPANDAALAGDHILIADRSGLTIYSLLDGSEVARVSTCGKARRVFVDGGRAYVLGLRSVLVLDITAPASPATLADLRLGVLPGGMAWATPSRGCSAFYTAADLVCDATGLCPWVGRQAADEDGHRLFVNVMGYTYVLDFRGGLVPAFSLPIGTGPVTALRAEGKRLYLNRGCGEGSMYAEEEDVWVYAEAHDVPAWVAGTVGTGPFELRQGPARLYVAERQ